MITKTMLKEFRSEFSETVKDLETKFGIKIDIGNINFSDGEFRTKLTGRSAVERTTSFKEVDTMNPATFVGKKINYRGVGYTVVEYKSRSPKFPLIIENSKGGQFKSTVNMVNDNLI